MTKLAQRDRIEGYDNDGKLVAVFYGYDCPPLETLSAKYARVRVLSLHGKVKLDKVG